MPTPSTQVCQGSWSAFPRTIEVESPHLIYVNTCSGCDEILVTFGGRAIPTALDRRATDAEITAALRDYYEATRP